MGKKEMILALIEHYSNGNKAQFASLLGITPQGLSTWIKRESFDIELIFSKCEGISAQWLLTGNGEMLKDDKREVAHQTENPKEGIPLIPFSAMAGALTGEQSVWRYRRLPACSYDRYLLPMEQALCPRHLTGCNHQAHKARQRQGSCPHRL